jgi:hypothetical protein
MEYIKTRRDVTIERGPRGHKEFARRLYHEFRMDDALIGYVIGVCRPHRVIPPEQKDQASLRRCLHLEK